MTLVVTMYVLTGPGIVAAGKAGIQSAASSNSLWRPMMYSVSSEATKNRLVSAWCVVTGRIEREDALTDRHWHERYCNLKDNKAGKLEPPQAVPTDTGTGIIQKRQARLPQERFSETYQFQTRARRSQAPHRPHPRHALCNCSSRRALQPSRLQLAHVLPCQANTRRCTSSITIAFTHTSHQIKKAPYSSDSCSKDGSASSVNVPALRAATSVTPPVACPGGAWM